MPENLERNFFFKRHDETIHGEFIDKYVCRLCPLVYADKWLLKNHLREEHGMVVDLAYCSNSKEQVQNTTESRC